MKNKILLFLAIGLTVTINAQDINQFDENNKRHGIWKKKYKNGRIRYQGEFRHGKEIGTFKFYSAATSEHPTIIKKFNENDNKAEVTFYTPKGVLKSSGTMDGKERIGKWLYYHKNGKTIMQEEYYKNNVLDGPYKTFYPDSKPTIIAHYKKGVLHGNYKRYSINNFLYQDLNYVNGKLDGEATYYNRLDGVITEKGNYKDDERVGSWAFYIDGEFTYTKEVEKLEFKKSDEKN